MIYKVCQREEIHAYMIHLGNGEWLLRSAGKTEIIVDRQTHMVESVHVDGMAKPITLGMNTIPYKFIVDVAGKPTIGVESKLLTIEVLNLELVNQGNYVHILSVPDSADEQTPML